MFKAKNITTSEMFVRSALDAFLSSQEETMFGDLLEGLAIHICTQVYGGWKAQTKDMPSIDLEFVKNEVYYIVGIKSGPSWANSSSLNEMKTNFKKAKIKLRERGVTAPIVAVNGCIYGKETITFKEDRVDPELNYYKYCGQEFWEFISGDPDLYMTSSTHSTLKRKSEG